MADMTYRLEIGTLTFTVDVTHTQLLSTRVRMCMEQACATVHQGGAAPYRTYTHRHYTPITATRTHIAQRA